MLAPKLRQDIYELWTMFWSSGMTNPLTSIEQITYLLFLKRLETLDVLRTAKGKASIYAPRPNCELPHHPDDGKKTDIFSPQPSAYSGYPSYCIGHKTCRWSYIVQGQTVEMITPHDHLSQYVFPWLRVLEKTLKTTSGENNDTNGLEATASRMEDAYFQLPREKTATLQRSIKAIDTLFSQVDSSDDLMGDIFEYLLSEIQTSGKNGQFRTPRHIIRFMVELLDPDSRELVADPAAGTAGFLINTVQHVMKRYTAVETIRLEWDGTPHHINGAGIPLEEEYPKSKLYTGYDNDRTMVRIGWMNMILHYIEDPRMQLRDTLSKPREDVQGNIVEESSYYDVMLANPPFKGTVDKDDLSNRLRDLATDKSELLFVLRILDMLKVGGRAAVIVPEGVLFGSTNAHKELRRRLLLDNILDGVVSLPAGVFQPYTSVKTSILLFHKVDLKCQAGDTPQTQQVWFYEIAADGYTLDAKRTPKPTPNDIWDALEKWTHFRNGENTAETNTNYYQPDIYTERWRTVDAETLRVFPELGKEQDQVRGIHELFKELPQDPNKATTWVIEQQQERIASLYEMTLDIYDIDLTNRPRTEKVTRETFEQIVRDITKYFEDAKRDMLERGKELPEYGRKALDSLLAAERKHAEDSIARHVKKVLDTTNIHFFVSVEDTEQARVDAMQRSRVIARDIVREFAKLDGYDIQLRSLPVSKQDTLKESKHWVIPVRTFARRDDWKSKDGERLGSHDEQGNVRPEYSADCSIYNADGTLPKDRLATDCIEYNDFNLSAGRHKPFSIATIEYDPPVQVIRELQALEEQIQEGLGRLLAMVEGRE